jgi:hypothetical protein
MLGVVLAPYGKVPGAWPTAITHSYGGSQQAGYNCPRDANFNMRGEPGWYYDTPLGNASGLNWWQRWQLRRYYRSLRTQSQANRVNSPFLGAIPTDAELAITRGYTPVESGWIANRAGFTPGPWNPPDGWPSGGYPMPGPGFRGLGDLPTPIPLPPVQAQSPAATVEDVVAVMNAHNDRVFALTLVSTTAVAISALLTVFRTLKLIREGKAD